MGITIGNVTYQGNNVSVINGRVIIDGKDVTPDGKQITINVVGDIQSLNIDTCESISVKGNVGTLETKTGDVNIEGNVAGDVKSNVGDIDCYDVGGNVSTKTGDIKYRKK